MKNPTIYDVAKLAGVSHTAVSKVINNQGAPIPIGEKTKKKIENAIRQLSYRPRTFRTRRTGIVAVLYARAGLSEGLVADPFYGSALHAIEEALAEDSFNLLITGVGQDLLNDKALPRALAQKYAEGVIVAGYLPDAYLEQLVGGPVPVVLMDHFLPDGSTDTVVDDNQGGMYSAVAALVGLGHQRIGYINAATASPNFGARLAGYRASMKESGLSVHKGWVIRVNALSEKDAYGALPSLIEADPSLTAVACANDQLAVQVLKYARDNGIDVPGRISVLGYDDIAAGQLVVPALSTVQVDRIEMGRQTVRLLMERVQQVQAQGVPEPRRIELPAKLLLRESTGPAPRQA